jgi:hypothetical protein
MKSRAWAARGKGRVPPLIGLVTSLAVLLQCGIAFARSPIFEDRFDGKPVAILGKGGTIVETPTGKGWASPVGGDTRDVGSSHFIAYDANRINPDRGTISFIIWRDNKTRWETVFSFVDNTYNEQMGAVFFWGEGVSELITGVANNQEKVWMTRRTWDLPAYHHLLGYRFVLPEIPKWKTVHFAFTWGPSESDHAIYVDGVPLKVELGGPSSIPAIIQRSAYLVFGGIPTGSGSDAVFSMTTSVIGDIAVYDVPLNVYAAGNVQRIQSISDDTFKVAGISGKLVAGDEVAVTLVAEPGGTATFDLGDVKGIAMEEVPATAGGPGIPAVDNGTYQGSYTIQPGDDYEDGYIVGHFVSADNVVAEPAASVSKWTVDTKPQVTFDIDKKDMPADSSTKARIKLVAKDANGNPVQGRRLKLTLATTEEYTGLVGAGDFGQNVGATIETRWKGETDAWGEVEFDYIAGFAAKTVILTAKDLDSGGVTVDYITAYKEAAIDIALTPPVNRAAARRGVQYIIKVKASRTELTAETFTLSSENGTLRTIKGTTDSSGVATAEYRAGKKIGIVVVTATATLRNASGNVSIILLSDAPAKIYLKARPETLPADGFSRSDLEVKVTDINDNPNQDTKVEFRVAKGGGKLDYADRVTDRFGDAANRYTAGTAPGTASIVATVRSKVPTEEELGKAKNVLFAPYSPEGDEIRVEKWLKKKGDSFVKGDPIVEYTIGRGATVYVLTAPYDGKMGDIFVEYWDNAEIGQTLAIMNPTAK